jgi:hypothetical protein
MKKPLPVFLFLVLMIARPHISMSQLALQWSRQFPQTNLSMEQMASDSNGNVYVLADESPSDYLRLLKYDTLGNLLWNKIILPDAYFPASFFLLTALAADNNSVYLSFTAPFNSNQFGFIRFDSNGNKRFEKSWIDGTPLSIVPEGGNVYMTYENVNISPYLARYDTSGSMLFDVAIPCDTSGGYSFRVKNVKFDKTFPTNL